MLKRLTDILFSAVGLIFFSPILIPVCFLVWWQDYHSPFYVAPRVGRKGRLFKMVKLRSMIMNADKNGVASTSANDRRITPVGSFIRKFKLDELTQLWNVFIGDMSLVGPRPNVKVETDLYTSVEQETLEMKPGITDFASIVFADEGDILRGRENPDLAYNQLIRPWKSRLALFYITKASLLLDFQLIALTIVCIVSRQKGLQLTSQLLTQLNAPHDLQAISLREIELVPLPPPGSTEIVTQR